MIKLNPDTKGGYLWFILTCITFLLIDPFDMAIWRDRAYLMYMSQTVFRGADLYEATPFGYTPLSTLIAGFFMMFLERIMGNIDTIVVLRLMGITLHALVVASFFGLSKLVFKNIRTAHLACLGLLSFNAYLEISAVNFEPKFLAVLLQIWAISSVLKNRMLLSGLLFSLAAMCWQPMVLNCLFLIPYIFIKGGLNKESFVEFMRFSSGVILGTLPCLLYLFITNDWIHFWNQAVIRKVEYEGAVLFESPFDWIVTTLKRFKSESLFLILGALGGFWSAFKLLHKQHVAEGMNDKRLIYLLLLLVSTGWFIFNALEFQGALDFLPLLPVALIFMLLPWADRIERLSKKSYRVILVIFLFYGFMDHVNRGKQMSYTEQKQLLADLYQQYGDAFVINFEEFYVIQEKTLPTSYVRMARFEDYIIKRKEPNGCATLMKLFEEKQPKAILSRVVNENNLSSLGECSRQIMDAYTTGEKSSFEITIDDGASFFRKRRVVTYEIFETVFAR